MEKSCIWNFNPVEKEDRLSKSWEEFCEMFPIKAGECYIDTASVIIKYTFQGERRTATRKAKTDQNILPDRATAEAVLALCQLIQLRNTYNGDWVPDWDDATEKYFIEFYKNKITTEIYYNLPSSPLFFKTEELRDEFLRNFRPLIEKLKPLYGIKEGGEE